MSDSVHPRQPIRILLVAPNVSARMGGEAIKAFHTMRGLKDLGLDVIQLTHERVQAELRETCPDSDVRYIKDEPILIAFYRLKLGWLFAAWSSWLLHRAAR